MKRRNAGEWKRMTTSSAFSPEDSLRQMVESEPLLSSLRATPGFYLPGSRSDVSSSLSTRASCVRTVRMLLLNGSCVLRSHWAVCSETRRAGKRIVTNLVDDVTEGIAPLCARYNRICVNATIDKGTFAVYAVGSRCSMISGDLRKKLPKLTGWVAYFGPATGYGHCSHHGLLATGTLTSLIHDAC